MLCRSLKSSRVDNTKCPYNLTSNSRTGTFQSLIGSPNTTDTEVAKDMGYDRIPMLLCSESSGIMLLELSSKLTHEDSEFDYVTSLKYPKNSKFTHEDSEFESANTVEESKGDSSESLLNMKLRWKKLEQSWFSRQRRKITAVLLEWASLTTPCSDTGETLNERKPNSEVK